MGDGSHVVCCLCGGPIRRNLWTHAFAWLDPAGTACAAHRECLARLGEFELGLELEGPW
jgi:hypothetical protein